MNTPNSASEIVIAHNTRDLTVPSAPTSSKDDRKWFVIYTRPKFEKKIFRSFQRNGIEAFLPLVREKRLWSDRLKTIQTPLLPSYIFVKILESECHQCYYYSGFVRFVSFDGEPYKVKETEISFLKKLVASGLQLDVKQSKALEIGESVRIIRGPLRGWEGEISGKLGNSRVVFQFDSIQQSICVEVPLTDIEMVK